MIVLFAEKPAMAQEVYEHGLRKHLMRKYGKSEKVVLICQKPPLYNISFANLIDDEPSYKMRNISQWWTRRIEENKYGHSYKKMTLEKDWWKEVTEVYSLVDPNPRSFTMFHEFYKMFLNHAKYKALKLFSLYSTNIEAAINQMESVEMLKQQEKWIKQGRISFYVDFCFDKQFIKLNPLIRKLNEGNTIQILHDIPYMSKYMLQCLYLVRKYQLEKNVTMIREGILCQIMNKHNVGNCSTTIRIQENCIALNLLNLGNSPHKSYQLSAIGEQLLTSINPECEEDNLHKKIYAWMDLPWEVAKKEIDQYMEKVKLVV